MINPCLESYHGRFKRIVNWEYNIEEKYPSFIRRSLRSDDGGEPVVEVVALRAGGAVGGVEVHQLLLNPLPRRRHRRAAAGAPGAHAAPSSTPTSAAGAPSSSSSAPAGAGAGAGGERGARGREGGGRRRHGLDGWLTTWPWG